MHRTFSQSSVLKKHIYPSFFFRPWFSQDQEIITKICIEHLDNLFTSMVSRNQFSFHLHIYFNIWSTLKLLRTGFASELKQKRSMWQYPCSLKTPACFPSGPMDPQYWSFKLPSCLSIPVPAKPYGTALSGNDFHVQCELFEVMLHLSLI